MDALLFPLSQNATGGVPQTEKGKHCVCQQGGVVLIPKEEASMQRQNLLQPPGYCEHTQLSRFGWAEHLMNTLYHDDLFFFFFWEGERVVGEERCRPGSFQWKRGERNHLGYSDLTWPRVCIPKKLTGDVASAGPWTALGVARFWPVNSKCGLL